MKKVISIIVLTLLATMLFANGTQEATTVADKPVTLTIWHSFTQPERADFIQKAADAYTADHPNVSFEIEVYPWNTFDTKWKTAVSTGNLPDLSTALPEHVAMMNQTGCLSSMNDFVANMDRKFLQKPIDTMTVDGKILSVPFYVHARVLWERADLLEKYGLEEPKTMQEFYEVTKAITEHGEVYGMAVPMKKTDFFGTIYLYIFSKALGANLIQEDGNCNLTSEPMIEAINYLVKLYNDCSPKGSINYGDKEINDALIQGKIAYHFESGFTIDRIRKSNPDIYDGIKAIEPPIANESEKMGGWFADYVNFVVYNTERSAIAKDFIKTLFADDLYYKFLHLVPGGMIPSLEGVFDSEAFQSNPVIQENLENIAIIDKGVREGCPIGADFGLTPSMNIVKSMGIIEEMLQSVVLGQKDVETAAAEAEAKINREIKNLL